MYVKFEKLNNYYSNIELTTEVSTTKFLNTNLHLNNGIYDSTVHRNTTKQPTYWSSKIPKRYKSNMILGDLHRSNGTFPNFSEEKKYISH